MAYLNGEFEVEPAYGEKREEALRIAGLKTFFIKKVVKPVSVIVSNNGNTFVHTNKRMTTYKHETFNDFLLRRRKKK